MVKDVEYRQRIGKNLLNLREKACLKREILSILAKVSHSTIFRIETVNHNFEFEKLKLICDVFGITIDELANLNIDEWTEDILQRQVEKFRRANRKSELSAADLKEAFAKFKGPTFYIDKIFDEGFLDEPKTIKEVNEKFLESYGVTFKSTKITSSFKAKNYIEAKFIRKNLKTYVKKKPKD